MGGTTRQEKLRWSREELRVHQLQRLNELLQKSASHPLYAQRFKDIAQPLASISDLGAIACLTKSEMLASGRSLPAKIFHLDRSNYTRMHQTSGSSGWPMPVLDSPADWDWWLECWQYVLDAAAVTEKDVAMMAFSFGPFIGFWTASDALIARGSLVIPGGGLSSEARLRMIVDHGCTVVCCTPTYALHLANAATKHNIDLPNSRVEKIIVAGEPGGSIESIRDRIQTAWGAVLTDHSGASELGAWGFGSADGKGLHVIESEFIAELLIFEGSDPYGKPAQDGELAELVLTNLGRHGGPAIRYRTGDLVRGYREHSYDDNFLWLDGGVLGRVDDMLVIRGVNIFPSSIESIVREIDADAEYRIIASTVESMDQLAIETELEPANAELLKKLLRDRLALRVDVTTVQQGSLPRFEAKAKRLLDQRRKVQ